MTDTLRVLLAQAPGAERDWRAVFDLIQSAAALDLTVELACCGAGLAWLSPTDANSQRAAAALSSLALLGVTQVQVPARDGIGVVDRAVLPVNRLEPAPWLAWLRCAPLEIW